jgi:Protein of unknown function (DUF1997)
MIICFQATETVKLAIKEEKISIKHYLRQPQRLVKTIAEPKLTKILGNDLYELKMRQLNFLDIYKFQPIVTLKVWTGASGTVYLKSENCEIQGIEYINERFSLNLKGKLTPHENQGKTYLEGRAELQVKVELPPPLWLTPKPLLEITGNGLLKSVLLRIKQRIMTQLSQDYQDLQNNHCIHPLNLNKPEPTS